MLLWLLISSFLVRKQRFGGSPCLTCTIWLYFLKNSLFSFSYQTFILQQCMLKIYYQSWAWRPRRELSVCRGTNSCFPAHHLACLDFILLVYQISWGMIYAKNSSTPSHPNPYVPIKWIQGTGLFLIQNLGWKSCLGSCGRSLGTFSMLIIKRSWKDTTTLSMLQKCLLKCWGVVTHAFNPNTPSLGTKAKAGCSLIYLRSSRAT
jgi:hypothetical protein